MIKINCWRITKYNPIYRDLNGIFKHDDWTSIHDIGKFFNGKELTLYWYLYYENAYIDAVKVIMKSNKVDSFVVEGLEKYEYTDFSDLKEINSRELYNIIQDNFIVTVDNIDIIIRLVLRDVFWCKLINDYMFVHFGYDLYMYIGSSNQLKSEMDIIKNKGLFIENMNSPYM